MLKNIKNNFIELISNRKYTSILIVVIFLSFGFQLSKSGIVNIDTLAYDRYFLGNELLAQGRVGAVLIEKIFHIYSFSSFFMDALACVLFFLASVLMCSLFKTILKDKISNTSMIFFSTIFVSYPLLPEIFTYTPAGTNIALCYILTTFSIILSYSFLKEKKKLKFLLSSLPILLAISLYESFASVYLVLIFIILILDETNQKHKFKEIFLRGFMLLIPLIVAIIMNSIISSVVINILNLTPSTNAQKQIYYLNGTDSLLVVIKNMIKNIYESYFVYAFAYPPIASFAICCLLCLILSIVNFITNSNKNYLILYLGLFLATLSLSLLQGTSTGYRTCQTFALFVAFIFMIIINGVKQLNFHKLFYYCCIFIMGVFVFRQCYNMNDYFYTNYLRYEEEKQAMITVANEIQLNHDYTKKIIVTGQYYYSNNLRERIYLDINSTNYKMYNLFSLIDNNFVKIGQTNVNSYINWGMSAFLENGTEINKWWKLLGYDFVMEDIEKIDYEEVIRRSQEGYVVETDENIIVNFRKLY